MHIEISSSVKAVQQITSTEYNVAQINSIADKYPDLRSKSKAPSFALTYQGTWLTLMNNCGFSEKEAKAVEVK